MAHIGTSVRQCTVWADSLSRLTPLPGERKPFATCLGEGLDLIRQVPSLSAKPGQSHPASRRGPGASVCCWPVGSVAPTCRPESPHTRGTCSEAGENRVPGTSGMDSGTSEEACLSVVIHAHSQFENRSRRKASRGLPLVRCFTGHNHATFQIRFLVPVSFARWSPAILRETSGETSY